jgi:hypothetical protein
MLHLAADLFHQYRPFFRSQETIMTVSMFGQPEGSDPCLRLTSCHCIDLSVLQAAPAALRGVTS